MKSLPPRFLESLEGLTGFNRESFVAVHQEGQQITSVRVNPAKSTASDLSGNTVSSSLPGIIAGDRIPWCRDGFYLKVRPSFTFDPLFHAGCYYVQDASSMFLEQAFRQLLDLSLPIRVLDLCAAPGGKSTHIQSLISSDSLLVSNEIIKSRNNVLSDNIVKWGCPNVIVSNNDPSAFKKLEGYFDVMVVDAPCSGSGLFRKDEDAIDEWSLQAVAFCSQRQKRILADALPALKEEGLLFYATCSYSKEENEEIMDWLVGECKMENAELQLEDNWNIVETQSQGTRSKGYRFYPDRVRGEGFFLACFRKTSPVNESRLRPAKPDKLPAKDRDIILPWLAPGEYGLLRDKDTCFMLPAALMNQYGPLNSVLNIQYRGIHLGEIMRDRLIPGHALAMSLIVSQEILRNELSYEQAIKYLQRQDVNLDKGGKGWQLVQFAGHHLGWINVLPNRINNYYPKELRILKRVNDSAFEK